MALDEIRAERIKKLEALRAAGMDPYPADTGTVMRAADVKKKFAALEKSKKEIAVAGRVMARREHGGAMFFDIADASASLQALAREDVLASQYRLLSDTLDIGDFIRVSGTMFATKRDEKTIEVRTWTTLSKSLRPLPEKWHGLQDTEERFRRRYLDLLMNQEVRERFVRRSAITKAIRDFHEAQGFMEVETPMLHPIPGGTLAKPFMTHHNALDIDLYLRIAPELYLKRLLVVGMERIFEIGRCFRNEGIDQSHNPEFTMLESYAAYWNEQDMMAFVEDLFLSLAKQFGKKQQITVDGKTITFKKPFPRVPFKELLSRYALITDYDHETQESFAMHARRFGIETTPHDSKAKIADEIYKKICRPHLVQPTFVINHPLEISPLSKRRRENPDEVRRFQLVVGVYELTNAFSELNDPIDQYERFYSQETEREGGEEEAHRMDTDFVEALEYAMPPAAGLGIGIDRVTMIFTDTKNIREVILFPTLRPRL